MRHFQLKKNQDYKKMYKQSQRDLIQSKVNATRLEANIEALRKQLEAVQAKIHYLERRDAYHDSPNVSPSKYTITGKVNRKRRAQNRIRSGKKPGA